MFKILYYINTCIMKALYYEIPISTYLFLVKTSCIFTSYLVGLSYPRKFSLGKKIFLTSKELFFFKRM